jgi:uncharacterized membrane protein (DUF373 family)
MSPDTDGQTRITKAAGRLFQQIEQIFYLLGGMLVCITAGMALVSTLPILYTTVSGNGSTGQLVELIDRLLFVLMLVEILHTIHVSIGTGTLRPEPFLVVGLIASIRRVLVITLESSEQARQKNWTDQSEQLFRASMIELGVLAGLIMVLVVSLFLIRRRQRGAIEVEA